VTVEPALNLTRGKSGEPDVKHSCRLTIETFVYKPDTEFEEEYGTPGIERRRLAPGYEFAGRQGRRDLFVDPRPTATAKRK
jgi:hypothetical protein